MRNETKLQLILGAVFGTAALPAIIASLLMPALLSQWFSPMEPAESKEAYRLRLFNEAARGVA